MVERKPHSLEEIDCALKAALNTRPVSDEQTVRLLLAIQEALRLPESSPARRVSPADNSLLAPWRGMFSEIAKLDIVPVTDHKPKVTHPRRGF